MRIVVFRVYYNLHLRNIKKKIHAADDIIVQLLGRLDLHAAATESTEKFRIVTLRHCRTAGTCKCQAICLNTSQKERNAGYYVGYFSITNYLRNST